MRQVAILFAAAVLLWACSGCLSRQPETPQAQFQERVEQFYKLYSEKNYKKMYPFLNPGLRKVCPYDDFHEMLYWSEDTYILRNYVVEKITLDESMGGLLSVHDTLQQIHGDKLDGLFPPGLFLPEEIH